MLAEDGDAGKMARNEPADAAPESQPPPSGGCSLAPGSEEELYVVLRADAVILLVGGSTLWGNDSGHYPILIAIRACHATSWLRTCLWFPTLVYALCGCPIFSNALHISPYVHLHVRDKIIIGS